MNQVVSLLCILFLILGAAQTFTLKNSNQNQFFQVKLHKDVIDNTCTIISEATLKKFRKLKDNNGLHIHIRKAQQSPIDSMIKIQDESLIIEIVGKNQQIISAHIDTLCKFTKALEPFEMNKAIAEPEVIPFIISGNQSNRIDVVFMGDGYLESERQQFIDDMTRLIDDMFEGVTFKSYLPVFNIWGIFVASNESGIGYNGYKDTAFRLYRQAGQLRAIFTGNANFARQICTLTGISGCDYPSLIGNDDFYGGLGGEFVISTKSNRTGTVVLRHEMGHNFVDVGEEYDGGSAYFGVNTATSVANLGWSSWLSSSRREERVIYRLLEYPWHNLQNGPISFTFTSDGLYSRWYLIVSVSAAGEENSLEFSIDNEILPWKTSGSDDREFYDWFNNNEGFTNGNHIFTIRSLTNSTHPTIPRMIASIDIHEFGSTNEFEMDNNYISAYPTWTYNGRKLYRPTNAGCLMRNMTHNEFCNVCKEGMWYEFLNRISLIDSIEITEPLDGNRNVTLNILKLGKWRPIGNEVDGEELLIRWYHNLIDQEQFRDELFIENVVEGNWRVEVELITPEVKNDPDGLLLDSESFVITATGNNYY